MSVSRIFRRGFIYVTRAKKRALIFLILYTLLTFRLIFSISKVGAYYTYNLYNRRGVEGTLENYVAYDSALYDELLSGLYDVKPYADGAYIHGYIEYQNITFVAYKTIYGDPKYAPRLMPEFKPGSLISGRYIESDSECIVSYGFRVYSSSIVVSEPRGELVIRPANIALKIVGVASNATGVSILRGNLVLVTRNTLQRLAEDLDRDIRIFRFVVLAKGEGLPYMQSYGDNLRAIASKLSTDLEDLRVQIRYNENADLAYKADVTNAIVAFFAASIVSRLYAILLTRIRRNEIAMLKTFGRTNREVTLLLLAELLGETFLGFTLGVALVKKYVTFSSEVSTLITATVALLAFLAVVVFQLLGRLALMFKSIGRIRPAEIARA